MALPNRPQWLQHVPLAHASRNAIAAVASLAIARLFRLPEPYWACITTFVVLQSKLVSTFTVSWQRLAGTALGAAMGALLTIYFGPKLLVFAVGVFLIGLICAGLRLENSSRLANITLAIVMLVVHTESPAVLAIHRFLEVAIGIWVALAVTAIWEEPEPVPKA
jgi:uncharacterized membrane protein YgaE (UPF0421/DUF939 family)